MIRHVRDTTIFCICLLLVVSGCNCAGDTEDELGAIPVRIPETTKPLSTSTTRHLTSVSEDGATFTFSKVTPELESLSAGSVIVGDATDKAPNGFLRKVVSVTDSGGKVAVETEMATLEEAVESGSVSTSKSPAAGDVRTTNALVKGVAFVSGWPPDPSAGPEPCCKMHMRNVILHDADGRNATTDDQIRVSGSAAIYLGFDFALAIKGRKLKRLGFAMAVTAETELAVDGRVELLDARKQVDIARVHMKPLTVFVGIVPVVIVPVLTINVNLTGNISVGVTASITNRATLSAGLTYSNGTWNPIGDCSNDFNFDPPSVSANCLFTGSVGPRLELMLYGVVGPYCGADAYLRLDVDTARTPWWELGAGLRAGAGCKFRVLGKTIADYYKPDLIDYRVILADAQKESKPETSAGDPASMAKHFVELFSNGQYEEAIRYVSDNGYYHGKPLTREMKKSRESFILRYWKNKLIRGARSEIQEVKGKGSDRVRIIIETTLPDGSKLKEELVMTKAKKRWWFVLR
jgi:hypothetical protein